ncbi:Uncharacterised protein [Prevotella pallens]|uniref:Uncharacterized protein n=1 Tax=Prevotella pallens TaxID=60133 RepID=A0A379F1L8_9BACT|nr:Uncharacterised protein [Prevotella pallens]
MEFNIDSPINIYGFIIFTQTLNIYRNILYSF